MQEKDTEVKKYSITIEEYYDTLYNINSHNMSVSNVQNLALLYESKKDILKILENIKSNHKILIKLFNDKNRDKTPKILTKLLRYIITIMNIVGVGIDTDLEIPVGIIKYTDIESLDYSLYDIIGMITAYFNILYGTEGEPGWEAEDGPDIYNAAGHINRFPYYLNIAVYYIIKNLFKYDKRVGELLYKDSQSYK